MSCRFNKYDWQSITVLELSLLFLACVLDTWSSTLSFCRLRSHRWGYFSRHISTFEYGITRAWNSDVDTRTRRRFLSFTWHFARCYLLWYLITISVTIYVSFFSNLLSWGINYTYLMHGNLILCFPVRILFISFSLYRNILYILLPGITRLFCSCDYQTFKSKDYRFFELPIFLVFSYTLYYRTSSAWL